MGKFDNWKTTVFNGKEVEYNDDVKCFQQLLKVRGAEFAQEALSKSPDSFCSIAEHEHYPNCVWDPRNESYLADETVAEFELS